MTDNYLRVSLIGVGALIEEWEDLGSGDEVATHTSCKTISGLAGVGLFLSF